MSAFDVCRAVEKAGMPEITNFLRIHAHEGRFTLTEKGALAKDLQKLAGDAVMNCSDGKIWGVEVKIEQCNRHDNFFLETWSNLARITAGWMVTLRADLLFYYFANERDLYVMSLPRLQRWAFVNRRIYSFPEREQKKYDQLNDTWGRCVPIAVIGREVGFKRFSLAEPDEATEPPRIVNDFLF